jgi:hypothetical protein
MSVSGVFVVSSKIKSGTRFMQVMGWYAVVMSLLWIFVTEIVFVSDFLGYTGQSFAEYNLSAPRFAEIYIITKKLVGLMILVSGVLTLLITHYSYSRGERWAWYALLSVGVLLWGSLIGYRVYIGYVAPSIVTLVVGLLLNAVGLTIPAREFLGGEA